MSIFQFTNEYNQRMPPKNKDGSILKFSRNKGYESIPRELAQNESLSYEARGLLISFICQIKLDKSSGFIFLKNISIGV